MNSFRWIGIDESGKGDFFGYLVIAGVVVKNDKIEILKELNVRDSKKISDNRVIYLSKIIKQNFINSLVYISPKKFNELYKNFKNINKILAWGHSRVIKNLLKISNVNWIVIDKFTTKKYIEDFLTKEEKNVEKIEIIKGESDMAVAAASIIARAGFLLSLKKLSKEWQIEFPKGASYIVDKIGIEFVKKYGKDNLINVSKINFKNFKKIEEGVGNLFVNFKESKNV
ncbi:MAG: ribonuclease HIII [Caldisericia bacterium]